MGDEPEPDGGFNLILWLLCMANPILNSALAMAMAMTGGEIFAYLKEYCENVLMNVLTVVGDLLWLLIRASIFILVWAIIGVIILGLTVAIASVTLILLPLVLIFSGDINYKIYEINAIIDGKELKMGYLLNFEYNSFFDLELPYLNYYLTYNDNDLIDLLIKLIPPTIDYDIGENNSNTGMESLIIENLELKITSDASEDISIISPSEQNWIPGFSEFEGLGNLALEFEYNGEFNEEEIALKYTIERMDFPKSDIIGYIYPEYTNGEYKFYKLECISEGFYEIKVEVVNRTTLEVIQSENSANMKFRINDIWAFTTGIFDAFGFFGAAIPILDLILVTGRVPDGVWKSIGWVIVSSCLIFASFFTEPFFKPDKDFGDSILSYTQGIYTACIITGIFFLYQCWIGYGGRGCDPFDLVEMFLQYYFFSNYATIFNNKFIKPILEIFGVITNVSPGGFILDMTMGIKDIIFWMIALDMTSYAMFLYPEVFKLAGNIVGFGLLAIGITGWVFTSIENSNWLN